MYEFYILLLMTCSLDTVKEVKVIFFLHIQFYVLISGQKTISRN